MLVMVAITAKVNRTVSGRGDAPIRVVITCCDTVETADQADEDGVLLMQALEKQLLIRHERECPRTAVPRAVLQVNQSSLINQKEWRIKLDCGDLAAPGQQMQRRAFVEFLFLDGHG